MENRIVNLEKSALPECYGQEQAELSELRKEKLCIQCFSPEHISQIVNEAKSTIQSHLSVYRQEFTAFFKSHQNTVLSFDCEENGFSVPVCIMGLSIQPNLEVEVKPIIAKWPFTKTQSYDLTQGMSKWVRKLFPNAIVLTHGKNALETRVFQKLANLKINTNKIIKYAIKNHINPIPISTGLNSFEKAIGFKRNYCGFIKDSKMGLLGLKRLHFVKLYRKTHELSVALRYNGRNQRTCKICGRIQDLLLYCLEDVFITILIYVYYSNRGWHL